MVAGPCESKGLEEWIVEKQETQYPESYEGCTHGEGQVLLHVVLLLMADLVGQDGSNLLFFHGLNQCIEENDSLYGVLKSNIDFNAGKGKEGKVKISDQKWVDLLVHFNDPRFILVNDNFEFPDLKFRWGSCTSKNSLNFNRKLIKAPMYVVDYVIVHELTHLLERNHTPSFWNIVQTQVPGYLKAREWLKIHGEILEYNF